MFKKIDKGTLCFILVCILILTFIGYKVYQAETQYVERKYDLYEMDEGVYAIYYTTHSSVPAHNYEVVTVCCNGSIRTFKGDVYISFINSNPYVKIYDYNIVYADDIYVYVPQGTVSYRASVNVE